MFLSLDPGQCSLHVHSTQASAGRDQAASAKHRASERLPMQRHSSATVPSDGAGATDATTHGEGQPLPTTGSLCTEQLSPNALPLFCFVK